MSARYLTIKTALIDNIDNGDLRPGDKVASENQLAEQYSVSRMTARRALTELVDEGILLRSQGAGTFVSDNRPMSSMLTIRNIHDEITQRGHLHSSDVLRLESIKADTAISIWMDVAVGSDVFLSEIVHYENGVAIQLERRYVQPDRAPDYLQQDFESITPNYYLNQVAPLTQADHSIEAELPNEMVANKLKMTMTQPILKVCRRTFSSHGVVSYALLYHPGDRYRLGGHIDV